MSYVKQNFTDGQCLTAAHVNHMEDGIARTAGEKTASNGEIFNNYAANEAIGLHSHAEGTNTPDNDTDAKTADFTFTDPYNADETKTIRVSGTAAHGVASHTEGTNTLAYGHSAHAEGSGTLAAGGRSHAEGSGTKALGHRAHAEGAYTIAEGRSSHAEGERCGSNVEVKFQKLADYSNYGSITDEKIVVNETHAKGAASHAEGQGCVTEGHIAHAEGMQSIAYGYVSHAEGYRSVASGSYAHAEGRSTNAIGIDSHAEGNSTQAIGHQSHAEGEGCKATKDRAHAEGSGTTASGYNSHAEGSGTTASGDNSHAEGVGTTAASAGQHVQGRFNRVDTENKYAHIIGNGNNSLIRSNCHTVDWDGNAWYKGTVEALDIILVRYDGIRYKVYIDGNGDVKAEKIVK